MGRYCIFIGKNRTAPNAVRDDMKNTISETIKYINNVTLNLAYIITVKQIKSNNELEEIKLRFKNITNIPPGTYFIECGTSGNVNVQTQDKVDDFFKTGMKSPLCETVPFTLFWIDYSTPVYDITEKFLQPLPYAQLPTNKISQYLNLYYHEYVFQDLATVKNIEEYTTVY